MPNYPLIFDIKSGALDDGPGIRTTVFLKGCPLSCVWCHNPESISPDKEISFRSERCIGCGKCEKVCGPKAIRLDLAERIDRYKCDACAECTKECPALALEEIGRYYTPAELLVILKKNLLFYNVSGGGVTFSGGEPLLHLDYLSTIMSKLKDENIHIALETCGYFDLAIFQRKIAPYADLIFFDLKLIDPQEHLKYTGRDNRIILDNFRWLVKESGLSVIAVIPLIPLITATEKNLASITDYLKEVGCGNHKFVKYNPLGQFKKRYFGKDLDKETAGENYFSAQSTERNLACR